MISIIVPSVRTRTVADTIAAILAQTDTDWELIISDQSGTDSILSILNDFSDSRIRRIPCPGRGASQARNFGILHARGDILAFTDDDCRPRPDWVSTIRHLFDEDPELWMATGSLVAAQGSIRGLTCGTGYVPQERRAKPSEGGGRVYSVTANAAYRRLAFERAGPFDICLSPGTEFFGGEEDDHGRRMELFNPVLLQTPHLEVEHTHGMRVGLQAVWELSRKYAVSVGAVAGKVTLLSGEGKMLVWAETRLATTGVFRRSPVSTARSMFRAYFVWKGYHRVLKYYSVDKNLRLLIPNGMTVETLYEPIHTLLDYHLPLAAA